MGQLQIYDIINVDRGYHCGQVNYKAVINPDMIVIYHCSDCQTLTGAPFRAVICGASGGFTLLAGELTPYIKTAERGTSDPQTFC